MWKELQQSPPYFIQFVRSCKYCVFITDYVQIWVVNYTEEEFLNCIKESNYGIELDRNELLENGLKLLLNPEEIKKLNIEQNGDDLIVSMSVLFEYSFKLNMKLIEGSRELFFQKVMQPALKTIYDLKSSEEELRSLLKKKDVEIGEYIQLFGSKIRYTALPLYNDDAHMKKHASYSKNYGDKDISKTVIEKVVIPKENAVENNDKQNSNKRSIKIEPQSQERINAPATDRLIAIKQETIKHENPGMKRKRKIHI